MRQKIYALCLAASMTFSAVLGGSVGLINSPVAYAEEEASTEEANIEETSDKWSEKYDLSNGDYNPYADNSKSIGSISDMDTFVELVKEYILFLYDSSTGENETQDAASTEEAGSSEALDVSEMSIEEIKAETELTEKKYEWMELADKEELYNRIESEDEAVFYQWLVFFAELYMISPEAMKMSALFDYMEESGDEATVAYAGQLRKEFSEYISSTLIPLPLEAKEAMGYSVTLKQAQTVYECFILDNPQFYFMYRDSDWIKGNDKKTPAAFKMYVYNTFAYGIDDPVEIDGMSLSSFDEVVDTVEDALSEIRDIAGSSEQWDLIRAAYEWMIKNVDYDEAAFAYVGDNSMARDYPGYKKYINKDGVSRELGDGVKATYLDEDSSFSQSLYSVFGRTIDSGGDYPIYFNDGSTPKKGKDRTTNRYTICAGYSQALSLLVRLLGYRSFSVADDGHQWNMMYAKLGSKSGWYQFDSTWDDGGGYESPYPHDIIQYRYFGTAYDSRFREKHGDVFKEDAGKYLPDPVDKISDSYRVTRHMYMPEDAPEYTRKYILDNPEDNLYMLYGPIDNRDPAKKGTHKSLVLAKTYTEREINNLLIFDRIFFMYDTPGYYQHKDEVVSPKKNDSTPYETTSSSSTTDSLATTASTSDSSSDSSSKVKSYVSGEKNNKARYVKTGKNTVEFFSPIGKMNRKTFKVPDKVKIGKKTYKVTGVAAYSFTGYDKLEKVILGKNIKVIEKGAFEGCGSLRKVDIASKKLNIKKSKRFLSGTSVVRLGVPAEKRAAYRKAFGGKRSGSKKKVSVYAG